MTEQLKAALWAGDVNELDRLAGCICCCDEHTFEHCPARVWFGCRGQYTLTRAEVQEWAAHYEKHHGMSYEQFMQFDIT